MAPTDEEQLQALGLASPAPPDPETVAPLSPAIPAIPAAAPRIPVSSLGAKIPTGALIPLSDFGAAYKAGGVSPQASYTAAIPKVSTPTAQPGTLDWQQQRQQQITDEIDQQKFKNAHPWGSPESAHPGIFGKIAHVASTVGNIAGDVVAPGTMAIIPGTQLNRQEHLASLGEEQKENQAEIDKQQQEQDTAQAKETKSELDREKQNEVEEKNQNDLEQKYRKLGLKLDPQGNPVPISYEEMTPIEQAAHDLKINQADAAEARAELDKMKGDPNSPLYQAQLKRLQVAEQNAQNATRRLGLSEAQFGNKLQEQELIKPSGQTQSRASAAQTVLDVIPDLKTLVNEHRAELGPVMGRLARGEVAIGDVDPGIARLYSAMKSFYALQPAVHGFRNAEFVKDFEHALGTLERDPDAFIAGMEGLKPTLNAVVKEGRTYHRRVVEGEGGNGASGNAKVGEPVPPKAADTGMKWQHRTGPDGKIEWRQVKAE